MNPSSGDQLTACAPLVSPSSAAIGFEHAVASLEQLDRVVVAAGHDSSSRAVLSLLAVSA